MTTNTRLWAILAGVVALVLVVVVYALSVANAPPEPLDTPAEVSVPAVREAKAPAPQAASQAAQVADPPEPEPVAPDVYAGHQGWCAPIYRSFCDEKVECPDDPFHPGKMRCVHPYWMQDPNTNVCAVNYPKRSERIWRKDRLEFVVDDRCDGGCDRRALTAMLSLEALKESTWRPWIRHRLNPDHEANQRAHMTHAERYGHAVKQVDRMVPRGNREVKRTYDVLSYQDDGNPHYREPERWQYGLGLFGMNAAGFTFEWDDMAPPEVLCLEPVAVEAWLRRARRSHRKLVSGIDCDRDGVREFHGTGARDGVQVGAPSWWDLHNAVNVGTLCPTSEERRRKFAARAERVDLDPMAPVAYEDLGIPVDDDSQNTWAGALLEQMERELPAPWEQTH